ncbi:MAG: N-acetylmuramoyl-L-alanine amidase, partial [Flavobacteriales bacterium]|nr:N-acetylmuramoyl-L-alanine amidase [Flavobacteriales bacterium]
MKLRKPGMLTPQRMIPAFLVCGMLFLAAFTPAPEPSFIVVLDAGHGGKDPGNLGTGRYKTTEKNVALDVTLLLGDYIKQNYPDVKVIYTRDDDTYRTLERRTQIANEANADLFISVHLNANDNREAYGSETFVMGLHKSEESLKLAIKENSAIYLEEDHEENYKGFDPKNPDTYIALSLRENVFLDHSISLAKSVQDQFRTRVGRKDRGVKQAGLYVISFTNMPAVLVELGFLTNQSEEDFLQSADGKTYLASAIYRAFKDYKTRIDKSVEPGTTPAAEPKTDQPVDVPVTVPASNGQVSGIVWWEIPANAVCYKIQVASSSKPLDKNHDVLSRLEKFEEYLSNGVHKYTTGRTQSYKEARSMQEKLRDAGIKDAFV